MIPLRNVIAKSIALITACLLCVTITLHAAELMVPNAHIKKNQNSTTSHTPTHLDNNTITTQDEHENEEDVEDDETAPRRIRNIMVLGNKNVPTDAILARTSYKVGEIFDASKTRRLIDNLYFQLKRLRNIQVYAKKIGSDAIDLYIVVEEKKPLKEVIFEGNKNITSKEIRDKINFTDVPAVDKEELKRYALAIQKMYKDKGYHKIDITTDLRTDSDNKAIAVFIIKEYKKGIVKRLKFKGNNNIGSKRLRNSLFTKEDWILSIMDKAGSYQVDRLEGDKHAIEQLYQNSGYMNAKVVDIETAIDPETQFITITYEIQEGDRFTVSSVKAAGNDILNEDYLVSLLPLKAGDVYSRERLVDSIKALEFIWGDLGYAYANIEPSIQPNEDDKTVSISFFSDLGKPVRLNRLTIKGNKKTRDKIIRRKISLEEGGLITNRQMDASKARIESLGYFDQRTGVNWKMTRLSEDTADLDLVVQEVKTGNAHLQLGFGGSAASLKSGSTGVSLEGTITDTNLFGSGVRVNLTGRLGSDEKTLLFNITQPWLFDKPIYGAMDIYHKRVSYDELVLTRPVNEKFTGGALTTGFATGVRHAFFNDTFMRFSIGLDDIRYEAFTGVGGTSAIPQASIRGLGNVAESVLADTSYNIILKKLFCPGAFGTFSFNVGKDAKNHPMHPSRGYTWIAKYQVAAAALSSCIGFNKFDIDANWFTPLIGDFDLVLRIHGYAGFVVPMNNRLVPYRELFHIGGPASVRGFLFGQIGPQFAVRRQGALLTDSIGGDKAFFVNVELIFPITPDFTMKGIVFYDGGAGWDNPYADLVPSRFILNNSFNYRHAVGVGIRLLNPMPIKVDWGFKLDPRKNEPASEVHFSMSYDW